MALVMIHFQSEIPDETVAIMAASDFSLDGVNYNPETVLDAVRLMVRAGSMAVFHSGPLVVLIRALSPHIGVIHFAFAANPSPFALLRAGREFVRWAREGTTYHRLEGRTANLRLALLATHCGAEIEGIRRESCRMPDGSMADEYELGYILGNPSAIPAGEGSKH